MQIKHDMHRFYLQMASLGQILAKIEVVTCISISRSISQVFSKCKENAGVAHIIMDYLLHTYYDWFTVHVLYSPLICITEEYVTCHTCRSPDTLLQKDTRIFFLQCESCGSRCSVTSIKSGFQAVTGKRAAIRAKTA